VREVQRATKVLPKNVPPSPVRSARSVAAFGVKIDAIPGHENVVRLRADRPGIYGGVCAEFCGDGHAVMTFTVEAHADEDYEAVLAELTASGEGDQ
jgi:heme/copper-type cytochrome/quinol oxidase subunit 2